MLPCRGFQETRGSTRHMDNIRSGGRSVETSPDDDFSSFEVMEEDSDFNHDQTFQGPVHDAPPATKVTPKVWDGASLVSLQGSHESLLNTYVHAKPFDYNNPRIPAVARDVPSTVCRAPERPVIYQSPTGYSSLTTQEPFSGPVISNTGLVPTSKPVGPTYVSTKYATAARWPKRSFPKERPNFRGLNQWQLSVLSHTQPRRINIPI